MMAQIWENFREDLSQNISASFEKILLLRQEILFDTSTMKKNLSLADGEYLRKVLCLPLNA
jgi:hypothetical protein